MSIYVAHNKRGQRRGGKVPQPGAPANAPSGACGGWYMRALVGLHDYLCGAQQARSAPRTNVRELLAFSK